MGRRSRLWLAALGVAAGLGWLLGLLVLPVIVWAVLELGAFLLAADPSSR